jgi:hypothetical protein
VCQEARRLAGQALTSVGMQTQQVVETAVGVHVDVPLTVEECTGLSTRWREAMQRTSPYHQKEQSTKHRPFVNAGSRQQNMPELAIPPGTYPIDAQ